MELGIKNLELVLITHIPNSQFHSIFDIPCSLFDIRYSLAAYRHDISSNHNIVFLEAIRCRA
jgi:hypothetical protein